MVNKSIDPILNFNLVCCVGGGFIALFGLVSYLLKEGFYVTEPQWRSLAILLGPGMLGMWVITSFLVWQLVPDLGLVQSLIVGACVTPTDPVLSNSIVKGTFADKHMSRPIQKIIIAESGANDGLGYLFLFLPLYLVKFAGQEGGTVGLIDADDVLACFVAGNTFTWE
ncbi:unnamed protein product [Alternaria alternata]